MKVLSANQIREADAFTIANEPVASVDLMERAARVFTDWFTGKFSDAHSVKIFCGIGNNGGDGLAIARLLDDRNYRVEVFIIRYAPAATDDFRANEERLRKKTPVKINEIKTAGDFPLITENEVIIDGILGSGLNRPMEGLTADLIRHLNQSAAIKVAIDIPSGLYADKKSESVKFQADYTLTFEMPKLSFFMPENYPSVGEFIVKSIGIHPEFIQQAATPYFFADQIVAKSILKPRKKFDHKGTFGHALIISGSYGKMGAATLCAEACLRAGAGLVTAYIPRCGYEVIQTKLSEVMVMTDKQEEIISDIPGMTAYKAIGVGPGMGTHVRTAAALHKLISTSPVPLVVDADALNILAENQAWLNELPENSILTPHPKEFERLFGTASDDYARLALQQEASVKYHIIIVLKRANTVITTPDGKAYFNSTGNPGMATGGSGDVLTGIITGLVSQGYSPSDSAILGVYLHGLAGDFAAQSISQQSMIAGDITHHLGKAFLTIFG